jgi:hypothetical protein
VKFLVAVGMKIESCQTIVFCYTFPMTTNDLITLIEEKPFYSQLDELVKKLRDKHNGYAYAAGALMGAINNAVHSNKEAQKEVLNTLETVLSY